MSAPGEKGAHANEHERSRAALRESESRLATALEIAQLGVVEYDPDHKGFVGDERWSEIIGTPAGSPVPLQDFLARVHPEDRQELMQRMLRAPATGGFEASYRILHANAVRYVEARGRALDSCAPDQDLHCLRFVGTVMDVTARKEAERALLEADRRKDEFLAMLGHELRNPLAPIANVVKLLEMTVEPGPQVRQLLDILSRQTRTLRTLVDDLLDVARITRGLIVLKQERLSVAAVVEAALESVQPLFDDKRHRVTVRQPATAEVMGDQVRLEQALVNVLTNAAKYMDPGGEVSVAVDCVGAAVEIKVRDRGIGIAPALRNRIFDLFGQAERGLDRSRGGLGIGLSLTKGLVELHAGSIEAVSEGLGKGAEFVIRLPLAAAQGSGAEPPPAPAPSPTLSSRRVLVVDDNVDAADTLVLLLTAFGHEVTVAHDGAAALAWAESNPLDLVLLDIGLPGMDGFEVARRLRELPEMETLRIAALTGYGQDQDSVRARSARFDAYFVKPLDADVLQAFLGAR